MPSYTYPLPNLSDYDVSEKSGFLPESLPLEELPEYYQQWEKISKSLPALLLTKKIRLVIDKLPILSTEYLETEEQFRRAYTILNFLTHSYIWGVETPTNKLPEQIAKPFIEVSNHLRLPPVGTYAGLCLWNYKLILPEFNDLLDELNTDSNGDDYDDDITLAKKEEFLNNIQSITTYTGSIDESWFYLISVYFEYCGASCIKIGLNSIKATRENDCNKLISNLQKLAELIDYLGSILLRMEEMCDPHVFYFKLRPYLAGWKNMKSAGLPDGIYYGNEPEPRVYSGGSNAQSSLIQTLDLILNVEHHASGESSNENTSPSSSSSSSSSNPFMDEMRSYMPGKHADFLEHLSKINTVRDFVMKNADSNDELLLSYNAAVAMLKAFRDKHIQLVTRYIIIQAQKAANAGSSSTNKALRTGLAKSSASTTSSGTSKSKNELRGTGGTALLPFLKQCRDETGNTAAGNWGRRLLSDSNNVNLMKINKKLIESEKNVNENKLSNEKLIKKNLAENSNLDKDIDSLTVGLAGTWTDDKSNINKGHW